MEDKLNLIKQIFESQAFRDQTEEEQRVVVDQIISTGEISREEVEALYSETVNESIRLNTPWLEKLPYDLFLRFVMDNGIKGKDVIRLCNSSPVLNNYCNRSFELPNGDSFNQYLFRLLMNRDRPEIVPGEYPRDTYKEVVIERRQDYNDLIELLDILHKISKNFLTDTNIKFPKTIEDLLYDVHQNQFGLLSDLDTDPSKYANYNHNDLFVIRHLRDFLMNIALETGAPSYQHPADSIPLLVKNLKEEIDLKAELEVARELMGPYKPDQNIDYEDVDGISHDLLFYKIFHIFPNTDDLINVMENYDEYYREVLNRYITKNYKHLKRMIIEKFENIIRIFQYGMEDGVGADIDEERTLADLGRIEYYLDSGNYDYVIDYLIELNYKVLRGEINVTTHITDLIKK